MRLLGSKDIDTDSAIREADIAMYRAKRKDEGHIVFSGESPTPSVEAGTTWANTA